MVHDREVIEREVHHVETPRRSGAITGFIFAVVLIVSAAVAYFIITDDDDNGRLDVDVPSVSVDVGE